MLSLRQFQKRFIGAATAPGVDTAGLSTPRGNGKSSLGGHIVARVLDPADALFRAGTESVLCAASIEQARIVFRFARAELEQRGGYRFLDSHTRIGIVHEASNTRLRVIGSNGRTAMGLVGCPWAVCDEPGAWETVGGELLYDAIMTAQGKPGSPLKALFLGTLAPSRSGWWHELIEAGTRNSIYVQTLQGDPDRWDQWPEIRRCNPLTAVSPEFRKKLLEERDAARRDSRLKARFLSYRLNVPTGDVATMLLETDDWERIVARPVAPRQGRPIVAYDLAHGRAWSAGIALWRTGRMEALAVAPGIPDLAAQEKRDRVPSGTYQAIQRTGKLRLAEGLRVQLPSQLHAAARDEWGPAEVIFTDRFALNQLRDCVNGTPVVPRVPRWSEASEDIRALRKIAADGPLSCEESSRLLVAASLAAAMVKNDKQGSVRMEKRDGSNNTARDDVAAAMVLAAGAFVRAASRPPARIRSMVV